MNKNLTDNQNLIKTDSSIANHMHTVNQINISDEPIRFNEPYLSGQEIDALKECLDNQFFSGNGPFTKKCQNIISNWLKTEKVLLTHSCTAALEMSAMLLDLHPGDEVIMPSYTFCSTASAFLRENAKIVFCEIDPKTMLMSISDVERLVSKKTKAIVVVHYGGLTPQIEKLQELCLSNNIFLIEDCAQGLGTNYKGKFLGTFGSLGCLSFHETKNIHCGLGGALLVSEPFCDRSENIWERGTNRVKMHRGLVDKYSWIDKGSSFYPSELQSAFLYAQLKNYHILNDLRREIHNQYIQSLSYLEDRGFFTIPQRHADYEINYHSMYLICNNITETDDLRLKLKNHNIHAFIGYVPLHSSKMGAFLGYSPNDLPITLEYASRVLRLPFHHKLTHAHIEKIANIIKCHYC